jgi:hypothetical protein
MKYSNFKNSEFFDFFNIRETLSAKFSSNLTKTTLKTGGFQEHIDLYIYRDNNDEIKKAQLYLNRDWVGNANSINPFGTDITKSFIDLLLSKEYDPKFKKHFVHYIFNLRGDHQVFIPLHKAFQGFEESSPEIQPFLDVYRNIKKTTRKILKDLILKMENLVKNDKKLLLIEISWK